MNRVAALAVAVAVLLVGDMVGLVVVLDDDDRSPLRWDPRVAAIARFVENERGLRFKHPVDVEFLDEKDYSKVATGDGDTAPDDEEAEEQFAAVLRAIGLLPRDSDLGDAGEELVGEATLAFYDFENERVVVRGAEVNVHVQVTLAHELTHALQDQHFELDRTFDTDGEDTAFHALVEGDADRVDTAYVEQLSDTDRESYKAVSAIEDVAELGAVPPALVQIFAAPYALGDPFVDFIVSARGIDGLNQALRNPPASEEALFDPVAFLNDEGVKTVDEPDLKDGEETFDSGDFGSVTWFVMLASHVDDRTALRAVDGWGGDSYVAFKADGKTCLHARFAGDTAADNKEMFDALQQWRAPFPPGAVKVAVDGDIVDFVSCDTGDAIPPPSAALENALAVPASRTSFAAEGVKQKVAPELASCIADRVIARYTTEQLIAEELAEDAPDPAQLIGEARRVCARERGRG